MEKKSLIDKIKNLSTKKKTCYVILPLVAIAILILIVAINTLDRKDIETVANAKNSNTNNEIQKNNVSFPSGLDSLIGLSKEKATEELQKVGLKVKIEESTEYSDTISKDCVLKWTGVRYTGNWHYKYEDLNDLEIAAYKDTLKNYPQQLQQVLYEKVHEYEKLTDSNLIEGDTITLTISKGQQVKVPTLVGMTEQQAKENIKDSKLKYKETIIGSNLEYEDNVIIKQSLESGSNASEDDEITLTLNKIQPLEIDIYSLCNDNDNIYVTLGVSVNDNSVYQENVKSDVRNVKKVNIKTGELANIKIYIDDELRYSSQVDLSDTSKLNTPISIVGKEKRNTTNKNNNSKSNNDKKEDGSYILDIY